MEYSNDEYTHDVREDRANVFYYKILEMLKPILKCDIGSQTCKNDANVLMNYVRLYKTTEFDWSLEDWVTCSHKHDLINLLEKYWINDTTIDNYSLRNRGNVIHKNKDILLQLLDYRLLLAKAKVTSAKLHYVNMVSTESFDEYFKENDTKVKEKKY